MKKSYILLSLCFIGSLNLFAQNITLPDVTTVIEGDKVNVNGDVLPDFKDVLKKSEGSGNVVPVLPEISGKESESKEKKINVNNKKTVYSEIAAGGGYPFLFFGSCDVQSTNKNSPFSLSFNYESANGYNAHPLTENYSDSQIKLSFEKKYKKDALSLTFDSDYELISHGLQNKAKGMSEINKSVVSGFADVKYGFTNGIEIGSDVDLVLYNRFASITDNTLNLSSNIKKNDFFTFFPSLYLNWKGYGFDFNFSGEYLLDASIFDSLNKKNVNRGFFTTGLTWENDIFKTYGNVGLVFGSSLQESKVVAPFNLGLVSSFPVYFSNRDVRISAEGGLESNYKTVRGVEAQYHYAALDQIVSEESFWYGKLGISIPLKSCFSGTFDAEYKKTAFNNGVWEVNYDKDDNSIYGFEKNNHQLLTTNLSLTFTSGIFSITGEWRANWFDVQKNDVMQKINVEASFKDLNNKWGTSILSSYSVMEEWSYPIVSLEGFVQLTPTVRLNASFNDFITLFTNHERKVSGKYIDRGFSGSVFLKFAL